MIFFYLFNFIISISILDKRLHHFSILALFNSLIWIIISPAHLDVLTYTNFFGSKYGFEIGYASITRFVYDILQDRVAGFKLTQVIVFFLALWFLTNFAKGRFRLRNFLVVLVLFVNSIFFKLGNFNVFRQYFACVVVTGAIGSVSFLPASFWLYLSSLFHKSSFVFVLSLFFRRISGRASFLLLCILMILFVNFLPEMLRLTRYSFYLDIGEFENRANSFARLIPAFIFYVPLYFTQRSIRAVDDIVIHRVFRLVSIFFVLVMLISFEPIFNELQSRVLYFYYFLGLLFYIRASCLRFNGLAFIWFVSFNSFYPSSLVVSVGADFGF